MTSTQGRRGPSGGVIAIAVVVIGAILAGGYGLSYLFLRDPAPPPVGQASASAAASASGGASSNAPAASVAAGAGTWTIDASIGSIDDFSGSFVGYRVQEELASIGAATAVGRTADVTGSLVLDGTTLASVEVSANLATLRSDDERRDGQLRRQGIQTDTFPTAAFVLAEPLELPDGALGGETVDATALGDLTLHGVTQRVEVPITASLADGVITVTGSIDIVFADYDIDPPSSFVVLSIDDHGIMEFQLHFSEG